MTDDRNYTMDEAAGWFRMTRRSFQAIIVRHPFYFNAGRRKLFSESNLLSIRAALEAESCRTSSKGPARAVPRSTRFAGRIAESTLTEARVLLTGRRRSESERSGNETPKVVSLPSPESRRF